MTVTGCQGPFKRGSGGVCGCDCKCCPPPCCCLVSVFFDCGSDVSIINPDGCPSVTPVASLWGDLNLPSPPQEIPEFTHEPIASPDFKFTLGSKSASCSVPCETVCVPVSCGGITPCCCIEIVDGILLAVGNGFVTAPATISLPDCDPLTVLINGFPPPVFVCDCDPIVVTLISGNECCCCNQIGVLCSPCPAPVGYHRPIRPLWRRKVDPRLGKTKINPKTGRPILVLDKMELARRLIARQKKLQRRKKN